MHVAEEPDFCTASLFFEEDLVDLFGTTKPTRDTIESNGDFYEDTTAPGRLHHYHKDDKPSEIFFGALPVD